MAADFEQVKQNIADTIYENGEELITGQVMQDRLLEMVSVTEEAINDVTIDPTVNVTVNNNTGTPSGSASFQNNQFSFEFSGIKGEQGNTGSSVDYPYELVNNVTTDDATKGLSAAQGVVLDGKISQLGQEILTPNGEKIEVSDCIVQNGYIRASDGSFRSQPSYRTYTLSVNDYKGFIAELVTETDAYAISFTDIDGTYIEGSGVTGVNAPLDMGLKYYKSFIPIPSGASFVRFSTYNTTIKLFGVRKSEFIEKQIYELNNSTAYLKTDDYTSRLTQYIKYSTLEQVSTSGSYTYYYNNDSIESVVVKTKCKSLNCLVVGFLDQNGNFISDKKTLAGIGEHIYCVDVPVDAKTIVVSNPDKDETFQVWLMKNAGKISLDALNEVALKPIVQKNRYEYYETLRGYIRHSENGALVSSLGAVTLVYKNQGVHYVDVHSTNSGTEGLQAPFNVISFYSADGWLGGQGYLKDDSIPAILGRRKHYKAKVPDNCGIILITLNATSGQIDDATASIELQAGGHDNYLDTIVHITDARFKLPSYYSESYLHNKINLIQARMKLHASNSDCFIWQTDEHFERSAGFSYGLIRHISDRVNIPRLFSGGDTAHMGINMDMIKLRKKSFDGKIYQVIGNHEYLSYTFSETGATTEDEVFYGIENCYGNEVKFGDRSRHYYYVDNDVQQIRYIVLSAFAQGDGIINSASVGYEPAQLSWFENTALNVQAGWSIIVFTHRLFEGNPVPGILYIPESCQNVVNIIEAYNGAGKIIAVFQGHTHFDRIRFLSNGTIPVVITTCDNNGLYRYDETEQEYIRDYDVERESGTIREHAFDVVTIDKTLKRISLVRIGCPARDGSEPNGELVEERMVYWQ